MRGPSAWALFAFATWSPKPGQTTRGEPTESASMKVFCPPCVTTSARPGPALRSSSAWGTDFRQSALSGMLGTLSLSSASSSGPTEATISGAGDSRAVAPPNSSNTARHTAWHSSLPVRADPLVPSQPCSGEAVLVSTVPRETYTTRRSCARASSTLPNKSAVCSADSASATVAAGRGAASSSPVCSSGPTNSKLFPAPA
mmetsp:Transcript_39270/g.117385  ORF Transcript_39270/g.117385 Transcript_39270/m.117385 type:complete len:200 (+) Transcript_39270:406-1005(+)